jgi:hypothetical protein
MILHVDVVTPNSNVSFFYLALSRSSLRFHPSPGQVFGRATKTFNQLCNLELIVSKAHASKTYETMSKQLLHSHGTGVVIAALNHRAFAVVSTSLSASSQNAIVYELMASPNSSSTGSEEDKQGEKSSNDDNEIQAVCCTEIGSSL